MVRWYVLQVSTGQETAVREALEAKLTGKGIRLLAGGIEDDMIEV